MTSPEHQAVGSGAVCKHPMHSFAVRLVPKWQPRKMLLHLVATHECTCCCAQSLQGRHLRVQQTSRHPWHLPCRLATSSSSLIGSLATGQTAEPDCSCRLCRQHAATACGRRNRHGCNRRTATTYHCSNTLLVLQAVGLIEAPQLCLCQLQSTVAACLPAAQSCVPNCGGLIEVLTGPARWFTAG